MRRVSAELEAEILRLRAAERWPVGTIATQLGVHHGVVRRVLDQAGIPAPRESPRPSIVDPYMPFIHATLERYPKLTASRLHQMVKARGYTGCESHFRRLVARVRPRPKAEAYARLTFLPGEQAQVDWGHFGKVVVGRAQRRLLAFVMTLSYSRRVFLRFFYDARMASFLRGHVDAFEHFGGVPRELLYDNLKSAVTERLGDAIRFNPTLLELANHYRFGPRAAAPARGNEKGRVERSIRYIRDSFFAARDFVDLDTLNLEALEWCTTVADARPWPGERGTGKSVAEVFALDEREALLDLPDDRFPSQERVEVRVGKTPYVRFDNNDYSVPHTAVRMTLTVLASVERVRVVDGHELLAEHARSYDKGQRIEDAAHVEALAEVKHRARARRGMGRLQAATPASDLLLRRAAERGLNLGGVTSQLLTLLDEYGPVELEAVLVEINAREVVHVPAVRQLLEQRRHAAGRRPRTPVELPDPKLRDLAVRPHDLSTYDFTSDTDETNDD